MLAAIECRQIRRELVQGTDKTQGSMLLFSTWSWSLKPGLMVEICSCNLVLGNQLKLFELMKQMQEKCSVWIYLVQFSFRRQDFYCLPYRCHVPVMQNWLRLVQNEEKEAKFTGSLHATCKQSERGTGFNYQVLNGHEQKKIALKWSSFPWVKIYQASLKTNAVPQAVVPFSISSALGNW